MDRELKMKWCCNLVAHWTTHVMHIIQDNLHGTGISVQYEEVDVRRVTQVEQCRNGCLCRANKKQDTPGREWFPEDLNPPTNDSTLYCVARQRKTSTSKKIYTLFIGIVSTMSKSKDPIFVAVLIFDGKIASSSGKILNNTRISSSKQTYKSIY